MLRILQRLGVWLMTCVLQADEEAGEGEVNFEPLPFSQAPAVPQLLQPILEVAQHQVLHSKRTLAVQDLTLRNPSDATLIVIF